MTTKTKKILLFGVPLLIGGYLLYKYYKSNSSDTIETPPTPSPEPNPPSPEPEECANYLITTASTSLNVRSQPNTSSTILRTLPKGVTVSAKPSTTSGWMQLCNIEGFVSSQYVTAI